MAIEWEVWRGASAGVAVALVGVLLVRYVFEEHLRANLRRVLDWIAAPLFVLFVLYLASDFLRPLP